MAAIYMWFEYEETIVLTTTLYPVDVKDSMQLGGAFVSGYMGPLPESDATIDFAATDGSWTQERWFYEDGPYDSDAYINFAATDGSWTQERWFYEDGPYDSDAYIDFAATDGSINNKLVEADTPDEELQLGIALSPNCSMELI